MPCCFGGRQNRERRGIETDGQRRREGQRPAYWYVVNGYFRSGRLGLLDALNLPLCYAAFACTMVRLRRRRA